MTKKIRSKVVKESLLDYNTLANSLKENTESAVKSLLDEAVRDTYAKLLSEDDDKDYDEDEVEDTDSDASDDAVEISDDSMSDDVDTDDESDNEGVDTDTSMELDSDDNDDELDDSESDDAWAEFDKYKVSDDEYDFSDAEDEEIVKVYKLMKNDDQILVHKTDDDKVSINDKETGAEYLIDLGNESSVDDKLLSDEDADDFGAEWNDLNDMNESAERMFELVLEYDSNVGYTDNYQKKDVISNLKMPEQGKNVNDWDAGVPHGIEKPWSKKSKKADKPYNGGSGKQIEEDDMSVDGGDDAPMTESAAECGGKMGAHGRMMGTKTHRPNSGLKNSPYNQHNVSIAGEYEGTPNSVDEGIRKRINKALKENKELRSTLNSVMTSLKEAAVTNHNLAQIIKLVSENTTSQDEKQEIISRFAKEAKTIRESKNLYNSISNELKKSNKMNITESTNFTANETQRINETTIYKSPDVLESLDLMHRMMK